MALAVIPLLQIHDPRGTNHADSIHIGTPWVLEHIKQVIIMLHFWDSNL